MSDANKGLWCSKVIRKKKTKKHVEKSRQKEEKDGEGDQFVGEGAGLGAETE